MKSNLYRKIVAVILGVEIALACSIIIFLYLPGLLYFLVGLISLITNIFFTVNLELLYDIAFFTYLFLYFILFRYLSWKLINKYEKIDLYIFTFFTLLLIYFYITYFKQVNKEVEVAKEINLHQNYFNSKDQFYLKTEKELKSKLIMISNKYQTLDSNDGFVGEYRYCILGTVSKVDSILISNIFFAPDSTFGLCLFSGFTSGGYIANSFYFKREIDSILTFYHRHYYERSLEQNRHDALINLEYDFFVQRKYEKKHIFSKDKQKINNGLPTILEKGYWEKTVKIDTLGLQIQKTLHF